jgi:hypothetical protein
MPFVDYYEHLKGGEGKTYTEAFERDEHLASSIIKFGNWMLTLEGDLINEVDLYTISSAQLDQPDWISQMRSKSWIDMKTFMDAYFHALARKGTKKLTIDIYL